MRMRRDVGRLPRDDVTARCSGVAQTCPADALPRKNARMRRDTQDDTLMTG